MSNQESLRRLEVDLSEIDFIAGFPFDPLGDYPQVGYVDTQTGAVHQVSLNALRCLEDDEDPESLDPEDAGDVEIASQILEGLGSRFVRIESWEASEEYRLMERFASEASSPKLQSALFHALHGRKPFRHFKNALADWPRGAGAWFVYRDRAHREEIRAWLRGLGIEAIDASPNPPGVAGPESEFED